MSNKPFAIQDGIKFPDGTIQTTAYTGDGGGIIGTFFVVANETGEVSKSTDGVTWTAGVDTGQDIHRVATDGVTVAMIQNSQLTWTTFAGLEESTYVSGSGEGNDQIGGQNIAWNQIDYAGGYFVAVGSYTPSGESFTQGVYGYSTDGRVWTFMTVDQTVVEYFGNDPVDSDWEFSDVDYNGVGWMFSVSDNGDGTPQGGGVYITDLTATVTSARCFSMSITYDAAWNGSAWYMEGDNSLAGVNTNLDPRNGEFDGPIEPWATDIQDLGIGAGDTVELAGGNGYIAASDSDGHVAWSDDNGVTWQIVTPIPYTRSISAITQASPAVVSFSGGGETGNTGEKVVISGSSVSGYNGTFYWEPMTSSLYTNQARTTEFDTTGLAPFTGTATLTWSNGQYIDAMDYINGYFYIGNDDEQIARTTNFVSWTIVDDQNNDFEYWNDIAGFVNTVTTTNTLVNGAQTLTLNSDGSITFPEIDGTKTLWGAVDEDFSIKTTRTNPGEDADIDISAADDLRLYAEGDELQLYANSNVLIFTDTTNTNHLWTFGQDGTLTLPSGGIISDGYEIRLEPSGASSATQALLIYPTAVDGNHIHLTAGGGGTDLYLGSDSQYVKVDHSGTIVVGTLGSNTSTWTFGTDGGLTFPDGTVQTTAYTGGGAGDANVWVQTFVSETGSPTDIVSIASSVEYDSAGNVIALFSHYNDNDDSRIYSVGKYTTTGTKIWTARFADGFETDGWGLAVAGNYIYVAGQTNDGGPGNSTLTKLDSSDGTIEWSKVYDFGYASTSNVVDVASDGNPVMVGYASNGTDNYVTTTKVDAADGDIIWSRSLNGQGDEEAFGMAVGPSGEVVAIGWMSQLGQEGDTDDHMLVVKYASDGTIAWQKAILFDSGFNCRGADADIDSDGNIYVTGSYQYNSEFGGTTSALSILKLDDSGIKQWSRRITGTCDTFGVSVVVGADDKLYLSGVTGFAGGEPDTNNGFTWVAAKYGFDGTVEWQRLIDHTDSWSFTGTMFFGDGGGSNLAVKDGYVVLGGGFGNLFANEDPRATVVQVAATGDVFSTGPWAFTAASFNGVLNSLASDILVVDAEKIDTDNASNIDTIAVTPMFDNSNNFLIGTLFTAPVSSTFDGSTAALTLTGKIPYTQPVLVASPVTFTRPNNSPNTVDAIDTDVTFKRANNGALYNSANGETSWNSNVSPSGTEWNDDGWGDLANVKTRTYRPFGQVVEGWLAANIHHKEFVMHDTINDKYYTFKFTWWQANGGGGANQSMDEKSGFSYVRQLINTDPTVIFVHPAGDADVDQDEIDTGLVITRGSNGGGIYNSADDVEWDPDFTPSGTLWNDEGWDDFENITARDWRPFFTAVHGRLGNEIVGRELLMKDTINNKYYLIKFTEWGEDNGGSFAYIRRQVNPTGTKLGITFADGTQQTTAGITFKNGAIELPTKFNTGYEYSYTLNGPTLQLSNDSTDQVVITGPAATANDSYAQRIVIQGQRGYGRWGQNIAGEGGDVYIWGGTGGEADNNSGGSGGDIKIRGGQGQDSEGGYVKIEAGDASHYGSTYYGSGGYVRIAAGDVVNSGGDSNNRGGDVTIVAGMARTDSTKSGAINLYTGGSGNDGTQKYWSFRNDGVLQLPVGADIVASDGTTSVLGGSGGGFATTSTLVNGSYSVSLSSSTGILTLSTASTILGNSTDPNVYIETSTTATTSTWTFGTDGVLTLPAATPVIKGGGTGTDVTVVASTGSNTSTWTFAADGSLTFPQGSTIGETTTTTIISPPGASAGQSFVIRPTGAINTESSHIHLVSGDPTTVDLYLGDDDQYVKIEKNGGDVVIGTNTNTNHWTFGQDGDLTIPGNIHKETDASIVVGVPPVAENVEIFNIDYDAPVWRMFVASNAYPNLGIDVTTGTIVTTAWGTPVTATIQQVIDDTVNGFWVFTVDQNVLTGFTPSTGLTATFGSGIKIWTFDTDGGVTFPDATVQTTAWTGTVAYSNITGAPAVVNKTSGSWTLATGANTVSITVAPGNNYQIWVNGTCDNGIVEWNATVNVSNTNVPVVGSQYGWYYAAGNALVLTSMPNQIVGTAGSISTATVATTTANVFTFGITNNSVSTQTVYWGYTTL